MSLTNVRGGATRRTGRASPRAGRSQPRSVGASVERLLLLGARNVLQTGPARSGYVSFLITDAPSGTVTADPKGRAETRIGIGREGRADEGSGNSMATTSAGSECRSVGWLRAGQSVRDGARTLGRPVRRGIDRLVRKAARIPCRPPAAPQDSILGAWRMTTQAKFTPARTRGLARPHHPPSPFGLRRSAAPMGACRAGDRGRQRGQQDVETHPDEGRGPKGDG